MTSYPKIVSVQPIDNYQLLIEFSNHQYRQYDVKPLLKKEMFAPLKNHGFFKNVQVEQGGYAISWNEDIDISEYELWKNSTDTKTKLWHERQDCENLEVQMIQLQKINALLEKNQLANP